MSRPSVVLFTIFGQDSDIRNGLLQVPITTLSCVLSRLFDELLLQEYPAKLRQNSIPRRLPSIFGIFTRSLRYFDAARSRRCDRMHFTVSAFWQDFGMLPFDLVCLIPSKPSIASASTVVGMLMVWMTSCVGAALAVKVSTATP